MSSQCFTIFEGGGAKGITHLGALKALEDAQLARIGAAGTSAGAIIAALTAAGYGADELFEAGGDNILGRMAMTPVDLLGGKDWALFSSFRGRSSGIALIDTLRRWWLNLVLVVLGLVSPLIPLVVFCYARIVMRPRLLACVWRILDDLGFFSTESARDILNAILREKLGLPDETLVCFRHIDPVANPACCRLKIITTNLSKGGIELFDDSTPDVVVADAVAASFSIPVFFKPSRIRRVAEVDGRQTISEGDDIYVDGGLLSNLPAWVFLEDKKNVERLPENSGRWPIPIIAFRLEESLAPARAASAANPVSRFAAHVSNVVRTGIFSGQSIAQRFVTHLSVIGLPTPLGVIQFDCTRDQAVAAYNSGRSAATAQLLRAFHENPDGRDQGMRTLMDAMRERSAQVRAGQAIQHFRTCLLRPLGNRSLKVIASLNMQDDADDDLVLDQKNPGAPTAFYDRDFTFVDMGKQAHNLRMTKYERALVRPTLKSVICVPIFEKIEEWDKLSGQRAEPVGVFCVDSDFVIDVEFNDPEFLQLLASGTVPLAQYMTFEKDAS